MHPVHDITFYSCRINVTTIIQTMPTFSRWSNPSRFSSFLCEVYLKYFIHTECRNDITENGSDLWQPICHVNHPLAVYRGHCSSFVFFSCLAQNSKKCTFVPRVLTLPSVLCGRIWQVGSMSIIFVYPEMSTVFMATRVVCVSVWSMTRSEARQTTDKMNDVLTGYYLISKSIVK
jgi:hypothetical protein